MNWEKDLIDYRRGKAAETLENARVSEAKKILPMNQRLLYNTPG